LLKEDQVSKRTKIILAVVVLLVVAGAAAFFFMRSKGSGPEVKVATVSQTNLGVTVSASGKVAAGLRADVYPPAAGTLDEVFVVDGQKVAAGDKLASMDLGPLQLQLDQAKSGLAAAKAGLANVGATSVSSADIAAAQANVTAAKAAWRSAQLAAGNVSSQAPTTAQINAANAATNAALLSYNNAEAAYQLSIATWGPASTSPTTAIAASAAAQANAGYLAAKATSEKLADTNMKPAQAQANAGVSQAYAGYLAAIASLKKAQAASPSSQKAAAQAAVVAAQQAVNVAQGAVDDATIVAPIDGTVFLNAAGVPGADGKTPVASAGSAVSFAAAPFSVVDLNGSTFVAEVDEADIDRLKVGMTAIVTLDSFPGKSIKTTVLRISPASQPTATGGTIFPVEIALQDTGQNILIGMKGDATIEVSSIQGAMTIPVEALFNENGKNFVYRVDSNKLVKTDITVGATTDTEVEVLSGLSKGAVVALSGPTQYSDGLVVRVKVQ
jgi:RND family efflux transporter MFP subunit